MAPVGLQPSHAPPGTSGSKGFFHFSVYSLITVDDPNCNATLRAAIKAAQEAYLSSQPGVASGTVVVEVVCTATVGHLPCTRCACKAHNIPHYCSERSCARRTPFLLYILAPGSSRNDAPTNPTRPALWLPLPATAQTPCPPSSRLAAGAVCLLEARRATHQLRRATRLVEAAAI
jgi:hypothetical protein